MAAPRATCRHCYRDVYLVAGEWIDPEATGDDSIWRESCDRHDTFQAEHEPIQPGDEWSVILLAGDTVVTWDTFDDWGIAEAYADDLRERAAAGQTVTVAVSEGEPLPTPPMSDTEAMDQIRDLMSGQEWSSDTLDLIALRVLWTGRTVEEPEGEEV